MSLPPKNQPVEVEIMGQRLAVASDDSDEHVQKVARYVNEQMRQLSHGHRFPPSQLALLAALNIASEYWKLRQSQEDLNERVQQMSQRVLAQLKR